MEEKDWKKFGEIQYLRGRLDELLKLNDSLETLDMKDTRLVDARLSKYFDKLKNVDEMAYHLYHIEKENIAHTIKRMKK